MIEVQCTSCHTRYRIDEQVLPEGTPTFKCSRCGHVFTFEPRPTAAGEAPAAARESAASTPKRQDSPETEVESAPVASAPVSAEAPEASERRASDEQPAAETAAAQTDPAQGQTEQPRSPEDQARRTEEFFSKLFAEEKKDDLDPGDNLAFDFRDEEPTPDQAPPKPAKRRKPAPDHTSDSGKWEVGDSSTFDDPAALAARDIFSAGEEPPPRRRRKSAAPAPAATDDDEEFLDEHEAPIYNRDLTHSARFFVTMFLLVGLGFGAATLLIHNAPAAASELLSRFPLIGARFEPPMTPARLVTLRGIQASYQRGKDGRLALLVTGEAENVGVQPLHVIQVAASLRDVAQRPLAAQAVYCGNNLTPKMATQMTPHEIEFFQKLDPPKAFALEPTATCPFVIVFVDPPAGVNSFAMSVKQAVTAAPETTAAPSF